MRQVRSGPGGGDPQEMSGEMTLDLLLPDSYVRVESLSPIPGSPPLSMGFGRPIGTMPGRRIELGLTFGF